MSYLEVRKRGRFFRSHGDKVVHLDDATTKSGSLPASKPPPFARRPYKFLLLFLGSMAAALVLCLGMMLIEPTSQRIPGFMGLGGILLLTLARRWADAHYDWKPRRFKLRLFNFK
ncbi:MAG: hypothetical protein JWM39_595 [Parcubacteria group bacterium]|nr:hypothetical protein [Parcubacteria group bacterium]